MSERNPPLYDLVAESLDAEAFARQHWTGGFKDYLELVEKRPQIARNAWQRLLDMIE